MYDNSRLGREIANYIEKLRQGGLTEKYVREQRYILRRFRQHCGDCGVNSPNKVTFEVAKDFILRFDGMSVTWQKMVMVTLRSFLKFCKNPIAMGLKVKLTGTSRTKVRWVSDEQVRQTFSSPMKPSVAVMVHLCLLMGLRMCEVLRIRWDETQVAVRNGTLIVHGKGYRSRQIPLHPDAREVLVNYLKLNPKRRDPDLLLGFGKARAEDLLRQFQEDNGIEHFSFHDMRRKCALEYFEAKDENGRRLVETEVLAELLGHKDPAQTKEYIGINLLHMAKAMTCYRVARWRTSTTVSR